MKKTLLAQYLSHEGEWVKRAVLFLVLSFLTAGAASTYDRGHTYMNNVVVDEIGDTETVLVGQGDNSTPVRVKTLKIDGQTYIVDPGCSVVIHQMNGNSITMRPGRFYDVRRGNTVHIKRIGIVIQEISIEEWKR
jgi:hypothetical protein